MQSKPPKTGNIRFVWCAVSDKKTILFPYKNGKHKHVEEDAEDDDPAPQGVPAWRTVWTWVLHSNSDRLLSGLSDVAPHFLFHLT